MKITFELDGEVTSATSINGVTTYDALELFQRVLRGAGYVFNGEVIIEEPESVDFGGVSEGERFESKRNEGQGDCGDAKPKRGLGRKKAKRK